jgi:hypothetical protein
MEALSEWIEDRPALGMLLFPVLQPVLLIAIGFRWLKRLATRN